MRRILLLISLALPAFAGDPLADAQEAFVKGEYKKAIELARPQIKTAPQRAWRVIGASSCFLKDKPTAGDAYEKLDDQGKAFLRYVCGRNAIQLP